MYNVGCVCGFQDVRVQNFAWFESWVMQGVEEENISPKWYVQTHHH